MAVSVEGHRERMRMRAERLTAEKMRPQDLMELLLYYAVPRRDTKELAAGFLREFGSVRGVLEADEAALRQVEGAGPGIVRWLTALGELMDAYVDMEGDDMPVVFNIQRTVCFFRELFRESVFPEVWQLFMTGDGRMLGLQPICDNAAWGEPDFLREALSAAMESGARNVTIGQFTLRRDPAPEEYDIERTKMYSRILFAADIRLVDHILISPGGCCSMNGEGLLDELRLKQTNGDFSNRYMLAEPGFDGELVWPEQTAP